MTQPVAPYTQPSTLVGADGIQSEGVNKVAVYYWDTSSLAWVKATGGAIPGANVNVTNFPAVQPVSATSWPLPTGASTEATLAALNAKVTTSPAGVNINIAGSGDSVDTGNSTTTLLGISGTFTGPWTDILNYDQISVLVFSDQASAAGGLQIQFSSDGTNLDHTHSYSTIAGEGEAVQAHTHSQYYRIVYTNGAVAQTQFRLQTILRPVSALGSVVEVEESISGQDDGLLTKSVLSGLSTQGTSYINIKATPDGGLVINQNIAVDSGNSSTTNLASGATFTGTGTSDLAYSGFQFQLYADQPCTVYMEQSIDNVNWDISDMFTVYAGIGNGSTAQLVSSYYRIRVTNNGPAATTVFRLITIAVPIINPLPRTLDNYGHLQTSVRLTQDLSGNKIYYSPHGEQLSVPTVNQIGQIFSDTQLDTTRWTASVGTGGSATESNGYLTIATGTTANNTVSVQSNDVAQLIGGQVCKFSTSVLIPDTGIANNTRRGGAYNSTDGAFYELNGTTFRVVHRKGGVDTQIDNGSFNGQLGPTIQLDTNMHSWQIVYHAEGVQWYLDSILLHEYDATAIWYNNVHLPITFENNNSGGSTTNVTLNVAHASTLRLGDPNPQPYGTFLQNAQTTILRSGPGSLMSILCSAIANNAQVQLYDGLSAAGTLIWDSGPFGAQTVPFGFSFAGIAFNTGLTIVITGTINVLTMYR